MEVEYIVFNGEKITDLSKIYDVWREDYGVRASFFHGVLKIDYYGCCATKLFFIKTNFPRNKKIEVVNYSGFDLRPIPFIILYDVGKIYLYSTSTRHFRHIYHPLVKDVVNKEWVMSERKINFPRTFSNLYFHGERIENLSVIRNFCNGLNLKFRLYSVDGENLYIDVSYYVHQCVNLFVDDEDKPEKFTVVSTKITFVDKIPYCTGLDHVYDGNIIFRGNKKIELIIFCDVTDNKIRYEIDEARQKMIQIYKNIHK